ncbi:MAG: CRISPR-associated endoribonuclease Cas6 [Saprospiraceae bacterium]|nr:CRISPR-associated endoribonuclease Cas6 [Saprospiraceae bacterium]
MHKWLGINEIHDPNVTLFFSWLKGGRKVDEHLDFSHGASFFISFYETTKLKDIIKGIQAEPDLFYGMSIYDITIQEVPIFETKQRFMAESPIFLKYSKDKKSTYYYFTDAQSDDILTNNAKHKLRKAGLSDNGLTVYFEKNYPSAYTKGTTFKGIFTKGSVCPIIVEGSSEQIAFIWDVGIGNSTGIGFGSLSKMD